MKTIILFGIVFLGAISPLIGQVELPKSITLVYHIGGDWRDYEADFSGAYEKIDSIHFQLNTETNIYESKNSYKAFELRRWEEKFSQNLLPDNKMVFNFGYEIKPELVRELIKEIDTTLLQKQSFSYKYYGYEYNDSIGLILDSMGYFLSENKAFVMDSIRLSDFITIENQFSCLCEYYKKIFENIDTLEYYSFDRDCTNLSDIHTFIGKLIYDNLLGIHISSYSSFFSIKLEYENSWTGILQKYPGSFNIGWIVCKEDSCIEPIIISPKINQLIYKMLPNSFERKNDLMEFQDLKQFFKYFLTFNK